MDADTPHVMPPEIPHIESATASGRTLVKVCGFREEQNLQDVIATGVDAIGLNFWPRSKRYVTPELATAWVAGFAQADQSRVLRIGVFVDPSDDEVLALWASKTIQVAQLHGNEPPSQVQRLMAHGIPVIKAVGLRDISDMARATATGTQYVLVDAFAPGEFGGTGRQVDWTAVRNAWDRHPNVRLILSGGITPQNASDALSVVRPQMLDVASGVESAPGRKDLDLCRQLVAAVRNA